MSATEIIEQFKALPRSERAQVAKFVVENDDSWIPESFKQAMADVEAGRFVDLDTVLNKPYPVINEIPRDSRVLAQFRKATRPATASRARGVSYFQTESV